MGAFEYQALDPKGRTRKGVSQGDSARQVRQLLRDQGLVPLQVTGVAEERLGAERRDPFPGRKRARITTNELPEAVVGMPYFFRLDSDCGGDDWFLAEGKTEPAFVEQCDRTLHAVVWRTKQDRDRNAASWKPRSDVMRRSSERRTMRFYLARIWRGRPRTSSCEQTFGWWFQLQKNLLESNSRF